MWAKRKPEAEIFVNKCLFSSEGLERTKFCPLPEPDSTTRRQEGGTEGAEILRWPQKEALPTLHCRRGADDEQDATPSIKKCSFDDAMRPKGGGSRRQAAKLADKLVENAGYRAANLAVPNRVI